MKVLNEKGEYLTGDQIIALAVKELDRRFIGTVEAHQPLGSPSMTKDFVKLKLAELPHEVFYCLFLDSQHRVLAHEEMFRGTLTQTSVYPREVVKRALQVNAGAVIFAHNHPSGLAEPSRADECLTTALKQALAMVDIRVLDHIVVGFNDSGAYCVSFAERGLL